jgi:hypothetical protein
VVGGVPGTPPPPPGSTYSGAQRPTQITEE